MMSGERFLYDYSPVEEFCFAPSESIKDTKFTSKFGILAERLITDKYRETKGYNSSTDFLDTGGGKLSRIGIFANFLQRVNRLSSVERNAIIGSLCIGDGSIPDIVIHRPDRREVYEIKPFSKDGMRAGKEKIDKFVGLCIQYNLPRNGGKYIPGQTFQPDLKLPAFGSPELTLKIKYIGRGIIAYWICIKGVHSKNDALSRVKNFLLTSFHVLPKLEEVPIVR